ncbi:MAG TPA: GTPase [Candidatus Nanoarchaeia archaeon]|nr:GTPase [Candidatus Nanoarchaeia archaeon]
MPINAGYEYFEAQKIYNEAKSNSEKIRALQGMLTAVPKHKGTEKLQQELKTKISKLKEKQEKDRARKKSSGRSLFIKKEGAAQVALVGVTNVGKSFLLSRLTGAKVEIADYVYTTKKPEIGVLDYEGIKIQLIEIPAFFPGMSTKGMGPTWFSIIRTCDLIVIVLDGKKDCYEQLKIIEKEFSGAFISFGEKKERIDYGDVIPVIVVINKEFKHIKTKYKISFISDLRENIWKKLDLLYVYTKMPGKAKDYPPVALKEGSLVQNLAEIVHKDFIKRFKYAKIWGKSVKHNGISVGLEHKLEERDIVEFHLK